MRIGGLVRTSFIDYPGRIAAVVFTRGCNMRCPYCHNPGLVCCGVNDEGDLDESAVLDFLWRRRNQLDGVVISGGEPTLQPDLVSFIRTLKNWEYDVKLDTNGTRPQVLQQLIDEELVDFVAMDVKAPFHKYPSAAGVEVDTSRLRESIALLQSSRVEHEFRTTCVAPLVSDQDLLEVAGQLEASERFVLQRYQPTGALDEDFATQAAPLSESDLETAQARLSARGLTCLVR